MIARVMEIREGARAFVKMSKDDYERLMLKITIASEALSKALNEIDAVFDRKQRCTKELLHLLYRNILKAQVKLFDIKNGYWEED
jgi:hypothetical protein